MARARKEGIWHERVKRGDRHDSVTYKLWFSGLSTDVLTLDEIGGRPITSLDDAQRIAQVVLDDIENVWTTVRIAEVRVIERYGLNDAPRMRKYQAVENRRIEQERADFDGSQIRTD